jgi:D-amino-acid dehydrogenase
MQVAVIGGGAAGLSTAFFLAQAGHEVVLIEAQSNVAEGLSFGSAGIMSPTHALPWAAPGMPKKLLSTLLKSASPLWIAPRWNKDIVQWARRWIRECDFERYLINHERSHRIASYSQEVMRAIQDAYAFEYESTRGYLQLYRNPVEHAFGIQLHTLLEQLEVSHQVIDADLAYQIEPGLNRTTPILSGVHLPDDQAGNCALFCKQLRSAARELGVTFHFSTRVDAIELSEYGAHILTLRIAEDRFKVDAVVVAAGAGSASLLSPLGIRLPFLPVRSYAATTTIRNFDDAPLGAFSDSAYQVSITRMGTRIRLAGTAELGNRSSDMRSAAINTLLKVGQDWFPEAANYNAATLWSGITPTLPDGPPILGATSVRNLYLNIGHGTNTWAMAAGCGRIVADLMSGEVPEINTDGLTLARYD